MNNNTTPDPESKKDSSRIHNLLALVGRHYPDLIRPLKALLAVFGAMALSKRTKPLTMIFEGTSGSGKTTTLQMAFPLKGGQLQSFVYRSDKFTPKAFVSHAANVAKSRLAEIDMLPKLENKILITKDLAPIFRGRKEEVTENFSILISVLDGMGLVSNSGIQGERGYPRPILFNWLGATTPISKGVFRLLSTLGNRLLFYEIFSSTPAEADLIEFVKDDKQSEAEAECRKLVNEFLVEFFGEHPVGTVSPDSIRIPDNHSGQLVRLALLLVKGRAEIEIDYDFGEREVLSAVAPESPFRVLEYLKALLRGHALIHGRTEVNEEDLGLIEHVSISSMPRHLRPLVRELRKSGTVDTPKCETICKVSSPTARGYLSQLDALGIAKLFKGRQKDSQPDFINLRAEFGWLFQGVKPAKQAQTKQVKQTLKAKCSVWVGRGKNRNTTHRGKKFSR